ncbi:hypothetical protein [Abyssisolibacter fermentans]|uniref:hypothetical protein n=1 Tax=Abyssisolibacter fermentans TaxID=1766203 RepID=UPI00082D9D3F|nr:hypothetical protein [Abyssisolibacter fermentans]
MKKNKLIIITALVLVIVMVQGVISYSMTGDKVSEINEQLSQEEEQLINEEEQLLEDDKAIENISVDVLTLQDIVIKQEVLDMIKKSDEANYDKNIANYKNTLVELNVQKSFKEEIERLVLSGYNLKDVLVAYEFLNINFGKKSELQGFVARKQQGKSFTEIFSDYNSLTEFTPRSFEPEYLERLMTEPNIDTDDIMIADIIADKLNKEFDEVISYKLDGLLWKHVNEKLEILSSAQNLPRIMVNNDEIEEYKEQYGLSEDKIVDAFVIAANLKKNVIEILPKFRAGYSREQIFAEFLQNKYN